MSQVLTAAILVSLVGGSVLAYYLYLEEEEKRKRNTSAADTTDDDDDTDAEGNITRIVARDCVMSTWRRVNADCTTNEIEQERAILSHAANGGLDCSRFTKTRRVPMSATDIDKCLENLTEEERLAKIESDRIIADAKRREELMKNWETASDADKKWFHDTAEMADRITVTKGHWETALNSDRAYFLWHADPTTIYATIDPVFDAYPLDEQAWIVSYSRGSTKERYDYRMKTSIAYKVESARKCSEEGICNYADAGIGGDAIY